jgi:hypothetical protein
MILMARNYFYFENFIYFIYFFYLNNYECFENFGHFDNFGYFGNFGYYALFFILHLIGIDNDTVSFVTVNNELDFPEVKKGNLFLENLYNLDFLEDNLYNHIFYYIYFLNYNFLEENL